MYEACSLAIKRTTSATSEATRTEKTVFVLNSAFKRLVLTICKHVCLYIARTNSIGANTISTHSAAIVFVNPINACLLAEYADD